MIEAGIPYNLLILVTFWSSLLCLLCLKATIVTASRRRQILSIGNSARMVLTPVQERGLAPPSLPCGPCRGCGGLIAVWADSSLNPRSSLVRSNSRICRVKAWT